MMASSQQQSSSVADSSRDVWQRWMPFWYGIFYVPLVVVTGITLVLGTSSWSVRAVILGLSLLLGVWYVASIVVSPHYWHRHPLITLGYLVIGWALWFALTGLSSLYLLVLTGLYPQTFVLLLIPWSLIGSFTLTMGALWRQVQLQGGWDEWALLTFGAGVTGTLMALFIHTVVYQSNKRQRLIEELKATRQELAEAERHAGIMQERQRLAHEIHDTLAQGFTSIVMQVETIEAAHLADESPIKPYLDRVCRIARENLIEVRRLLWALQPEALERAPLAEVLTTLTARWSEENTIRASVTITGTCASLRPETEVTLLRAAQEALANIGKYARASTVTLTLSYIDDFVMLDVQDDGCGFDPERVLSTPTDQSAGGFGLKVLRGRVVQLGGTLSLESAPGEGTTLAVALPVSSNTTSLAHETVLEK